MNAEQYARDSFSLLNQRASELGVSVENRYRVTDKLVQEMIQLIRKEPAGYAVARSRQQIQARNDEYGNALVAFSVSR